jgi:hypothetical protein
VKDFANVLMVLAIVATVAFVCLIGEDDGPSEDYADDAGGARFRLIG